VSRAELRAAVEHLVDLAPPADADPDGEWRTALIDRFASVRAFVPLLCANEPPSTPARLGNRSPHTSQKKSSQTYPAARGALSSRSPGRS
jgi:hypothetical protein